jgi:hypothetical protein
MADAAARMKAVMIVRGLETLHDSQYYRFTRAERKALRLAMGALQRFIDRAIDEEGL